MRVAAEAIAQIAEVYTGRAEAILSTLDGEPIPTEPILGAVFLAGLVKQSTSLHLEALVEAAPQSGNRALTTRFIPLPE